MAKHDPDNIVAMGSEMFRRGGYSATGVDQILRSAGIPKGSFYNFFESKESFGVKALEHYTEQQRRFVTSILGQEHGTVLSRIEELYRTLTAENAKEGYRNGCLIGNFAFEIGGRSEQIAQKAAESLRSIVEIIAGALLTGQQNGEVRADVPARELAWTIHQGFYGVLMRMKIERSDAPLESFVTFQIYGQQR